MPANSGALTVKYCIRAVISLLFKYQRANAKRDRIAVYGMEVKGILDLGELG
jgi:hypothetical protein